MKNVIVCVFIGCVLLAACRQDKHPQGIAHVVVIGIDGLSAQGLREATTPCLDSLTQNGASNYAVRCVLPTVSTPNWNAMLTGAGPDITGVTGNGWDRNTFDLPPVIMTENRMFPNIFRVMREQKPEWEIGSVFDWGGFGNMLEAELLNTFENASGSPATAQKAAEYILEKKPHFLFIQLDEVDGHGHGKGHMSPGYLEGITEMDKQVRVIVDAIRQAGIADNTLIMVVSDHGGLYYGHGGNSYEELTVPVIFSGKGIKKNYRIKQQMYMYDVAANIAFAFGLKTPQAWVGRPTKPAFEGFDEPDNLWKGVDMLPPPAFQVGKVIEPQGDLYVDRPAEVVIRIPEGVEGVIRYTTDGTAPAKESPAYTAPFTVQKSTVITARIFSPDGESANVKAYYRVADSKAGNGLNVAFYKQNDIREIPSFRELKPVATAVCHEFSLLEPDVKTLVDQYATDFAVTFSGKIQIDADGLYTFSIRSNDGCKLYIDSELTVNSNSLGGVTNSGKIELTKGLHTIRMEYFNHDKECRLYAWYEGPGAPYQIIPADKLFKN
ncbi:MAG: alkaline phosphatase family protein [Tannerella sp.]|jgi:hypothetical protein|nr:alkaline phosphatase family protein [Tannerella sp.]